MSAELDALDRGVIEAGLTAAEALARVEKLERTVAALVRGIAAINEHAGLPSDLVRPADQETSRPHLTVVPQ